MSCERFREALSRHAAGDGIDGAAAAHLAVCRACAARLDLQRRLLSEVDGELERVLSVEASQELVDRVVSQRQFASDSVWRFRAAWVGLAAAALLAVGTYLRAPSTGTTVSPPKSAASEPAVPPASAAVPVAPSVVESRAQGPKTLPPRGGLQRSPRAGVRQQTVKPVNQPPVIVSPDQALAIQRLRELMTQGRLNEKMLPPPLTPEAVLAELTIAPLEIAEIRVPDVEIIGRPPAAPQRQ